jgi:hypothetical protein
LIDEMLNTLIGVGRFNDPKSEELLSKLLIERRNAIFRRCLPAVNRSSTCACRLRVR